MSWLIVPIWATVFILSGFASAASYLELGWERFNTIMIRIFIGSALTAILVAIWVPVTCYKLGC